MTDEQPFEISEHRPEPATHTNRQELTILAKAVSYLFHPLFMSLYAFFFVDLCYPFLFAHMDKVEKMRLIVVLITNTIVFPLITIIMIQKLGFSKTLQMVNRKERILPYIAMCTFSFWTFMVVRKLAVGELFTHILLGISFAIFAAFFFNNFFKISIHAVGAGTFVALAFVVAMVSNYNLMPALLVIILLAGVIGSARLYLHAHVTRDIYWGYGIGVLAQIVAFVFF